MFIYYFVDSDLRVEIFFEREEITDNLRLFYMKKKMPEERYDPMFFLRKKTENLTSRAWEK